MMEDGEGGEMTLCGTNSQRYKVNGDTIQYRGIRSLLIGSPHSGANPLDFVDCHGLLASEVSQFIVDTIGIPQNCFLQLELSADRHLAVFIELKCFGYFGHGDFPHCGSLFPDSSHQRKNWCTKLCGWMAKFGLFDTVHFTVHHSYNWQL